MKLSIVIVNYNVQHYLQLCLDSVFEALQNLDSEVIVVDNASVDGSVQMMETNFPAVKVISSSVNLGFSKANNIGIEAARGEYICILNPDTMVGEQVFEEIYAFAKAQPKTGIVGVQLVDGTGHFLPESKRNLPTPRVSLRKMVGDNALYYASHIPAMDNCPVPVLVGAFMFLKKVIYLEAGGFDERYFMYGEDIDLSYSVSKSGFDNYYLGAQKIIHFKGESTIKNKIYRERFFGAMSIFYKKYFKKNQLEQLIVQFGIKAASFKSMVRDTLFTHKERNIMAEPTSYILVSNQGYVQKSLENMTSKTVRITDILKSYIHGEEIIFDASYISYSDIIKEIITHRDSGVTFKIIPKNCTFAIGSNSSDGRGEVIHFVK